MNVIDALAQLPPNTVHQTAMKVGGFVVAVHSCLDLLLTPQKCRHLAHYLAARRH